MRIGIDIDDVLNNLTACVLEVYNKDSGDDLKFADITEYDMTLFVKDKYKKNFFKYFADKRVWDIVMPNMKGFNLINKLYEQGHKIYFVTATHPLNVGNKYKWLNQYLDWDVWESLVVTKDKSLLTGLDILLDDHLGNLNFESENTTFVLYSRPWNVGKDSGSCLRMNSWQWFEQLVNILDQQEKGVIA